MAGKRARLGRLWRKDPEDSQTSSRCFSSQVSRILKSNLNFFRLYKLTLSSKWSAYHYLIWYVGHYPNPPPLKLLFEFRQLVFSLKNFWEIVLVLVSDASCTVCVQVSEALSTVCVQVSDASCTASLRGQRPLILLASVAKPCYALSPSLSFLILSITRYSLAISGLLLVMGEGDPFLSH